MIEKSSVDETLELTEKEIEYYLEKKYRKVYSERLSRKVYTLIEWVNKDVFKRHKKLFGYTDIGWTVKHPKQLIRTMIREGIWELDPEISDKLAVNDEEFIDSSNDE